MKNKEKQTGHISNIRQICMIFKLAYSKAKPPSSD